jgi:hypothetical protein
LKFCNKCKCKVVTKIVKGTFQHENDRYVCPVCNNDLTHSIFVKILGWLFSTSLLLFVLYGIFVGN